MIDKTLDFVFEHQQRFKTIGIGRTDSKVSANTYYFQLFVNDKLKRDNFLLKFNSNAPQDIKGVFIKEKEIEFNIIQAPKVKEYHYYFSYGAKNHPFASPFLVGFEEDLDIELMINGAKLFKGIHYFNKYCTKPSVTTSFKRTIISCEIVENNILEANFFPRKSYVLKVRGAGFLRYQIRLMMGVLFELGLGRIDLNFIKKSLSEDNDKRPLKTIAAASGLQLFDVELL